MKPAVRIIPIGGLGDIGGIQIRLRKVIGLSQKKIAEAKYSGSLRFCFIPTFSVQLPFLLLAL
jgi:hypothetical protein